jgi:hypothetical protein
MATPKLVRIVLTDLNVSFYLPVNQQTEFHLKFADIPSNVKNGLIKLVMNHKPKGDYYIIEEIRQYLVSCPNKAMQEIKYILNNSIEQVQIEPG